MPPEEDDIDDDIRGDLNDTADDPVPLDPYDPDNLVKIGQKEDPPDGPPRDVKDTQSDHQQKDTNVHREEVIDEGEDAAAEIDDPLRSGPPRDFARESADAEGFDEDGTEEASKDSFPGDTT